MFRSSCSAAARVAEPHNYSLDLLRIFACFLVVLLHVAASQFYSISPSGEEWRVFNFYDTLSRSCVPLFFMLSGYLFLSRETPIDLKRLFIRNILKLLFLYLLWAAFYALDTASLSASGSTGFLSTFYDAFLTPKFHLWYLPAAIGLYLLVPFLQGAVQHWNGTFVHYFCLLFFCTIFYNTLRLLSEIYQGPFFSFLETLSVFSPPFSYPLGYFVLGYALGRQSFSNLKWWQPLAAFAALVCLFAFLNRQHALFTNTPSTILYDSNLLPAFAEAVCLFAFFRKLPIEKLSSGSKFLIFTVSKCTLGIYLLHVFVLEHLSSTFHIRTTSFQPWLSVPLISLLVFGICLLVVCLLKKIPYIGNLIT